MQQAREQGEAASLKMVCEQQNNSLTTLQNDKMSLMASVKVAHERLDTLTKQTTKQDGQLTASLNKERALTQELAEVL